MEVCIEHKAETEYCDVDWETVRNKYELIQEKLIQQYLKNSTDVFPISENAEQKMYWQKVSILLRHSIELS